MSRAKLNWRGEQVLAAKGQQLIDAMTEVGLRIEAAAKAELYPGHGKRTGTLQRSIQAQPARIEGLRVVTRIGTKGVSYALRIHKRYQYLVKGAEKVRPRVTGIIRKHCNG